MKKVLLVIGTRPEAIKLAPICRALRPVRDIDTVFLTTGQHKEMVEPILNFFEITPDFQMDIMQQNQTLTSLTAKLFADLGESIDKIEPDLIVVQGDTTTAMVASMLAFYRRIPLAHVEAGLRSADRQSPFPEEVNRRIISQVADLHFAPTQSAAKNIQEQGQVLVVGNTVVDSLLFGLDKVKSDLSQYEGRYVQLVPPLKKLILVTAHRRESFEGGLESIFRGIVRLAENNSELYFVFPVHFNPNVRMLAEKILSNNNQISLIDPLPYDDMIYLMSRSFLILTDSGGVQEEAPSLNVPVLVTRDTTERWEGVRAGCAKLVGTSSETIVREVELLLTDQQRYMSMQNVENPYGDGSSSKRIADEIRKWLSAR